MTTGRATSTDDPPKGDRTDAPPEESPNASISLISTERFPGVRTDAPAHVLWGPGKRSLPDDPTAAFPVGPPRSEGYPGNPVRTWFFPLLWIALALAFLRLLPYSPPPGETVKYPDGQAFSPSMVAYLRFVFEESDPPLYRQLGAESLAYRIEGDLARVELKNPEGNQRNLLLSASALREGEDLGWCQIRFEPGFSPDEQDRLRTSLFAPENNSIAWMPESERDERLFGRFRFSDLYAHVVMILMAIILLALALHLAPILVSRPFAGGTAFLVGLGLLLLWGMTDPAPGDIKLHFIREDLNVYAWDLYGPGYFAWQKLLFRLLPASDSLLFHANRWAGLISALLISLVAARRFRLGHLAWAAGTLLLFHPMWLRYSASDLTHPLSFLFFFGSAAIWLAPGDLTRRRIFIASISLALSTLGRGEFMMLIPAFLLLVGPGPLLHALRRHPRTVVYSALSALILLTPALTLLAAQVRLDPEELVSLSPIDGLKALLLIEGNTFSDLRFSVWPSLLLLAAGVVWGLIRMPGRTWPLLLIPAFFLWNPYVLQPVFSSTHYQLPALPFYILLSTLGVAALGRLLNRRLGFFWSDAGTWIILLFSSSLALSEFAGTLKGDTTFIETYRFLAEQRDRFPSDCRLFTIRPPGDHDLFNPWQIFLFNEGPPMPHTDLAQTPTPGGTGECALYARLPACSVVAEVKQAPHTRFLDLCRSRETLLGPLEPLAEREIPAREACGERYAGPSIRIGIYQVAGESPPP